jgi:KEOPS complex subunit Pcc1
VTARPDHEHAASLTVEYDDPDSARGVARSVRREVDEIGGDRSRAAVERDGATVTVEVTASDLVGLRAGLNTWLGLVEVAERALGAAR